MRHRTIARSRLGLEGARLILVSAPLDDEDDLRTVEDALARYGFRDNLPVATILLRRWAPDAELLLPMLDRSDWVPVSLRCSQAAERAPSARVRATWYGSKGLVKHSLKVVAIGPRARELAAARTEAALRCALVVQTARARYPQGAGTVSWCWRASVRFPATPGGAAKTTFKLWRPAARRAGRSFERRTT